LWGLLLFAACGIASLAQAEDGAGNYPQRPIRMVVPYAPGGGTDIVARVAAKELSEALGQAVVVENKPGGSGILATVSVARAAPDGYTLLAAPSGPLVMNPVLRKSLPYNPQTDFVPVSVIGRLPLLITVNSTLPVKSVKELIDYAKAHPNNLNYASSAPLFQLATELFKQKTGTNFIAVPYKSSGESATALLSDQVTLSISDVPPVAGLIRDGRLRALAYTDTRRSAEFPDVPTVSEAGLSGTEVATLVGIVAPAGTPAAIVRKLQDVLVAMVKKPDVRERLAKIGVEPVGSTSKEFADDIKNDIARWEDVAQRAHIEKQ
ncbi:MAG TPA: tripartite tricarboxylate transporter substrate binding protein, partial [Pseudolabrys sp.]|nr:tripartite tricarboxylate transporter substrate binding protein [Pseudolabrys sp.]